MFYSLILFAFPFFANACRLKDPQTGVALFVTLIFLSLFFAIPIATLCYITLRLLPRYKQLGIKWALKRSLIIGFVTVVLAFILLPGLLGWNYCI